jgi:hypothetical protein
MSTTSSSSSAVDIIQTICNIIIAVASILITILINVYRLVQGEVERRNAARAMIAQADTQIDSEFAALFFHRSFMDPNNNLLQVSDGDYDTIMSEAQFVYGNAAIMRVKLVSFLETLRAASYVAYDHLPVKKSRSANSNDNKISDSTNNSRLGYDPLKKIWTGKYDPITTNLRIAIQNFTLFWNTPHLGDPSLLETRRAYLRKLFGEDSDGWFKFCAVASLFDENAKFDGKMKGGVVTVKADVDA